MDRQDRHRSYRRHCHHRQGGRLADDHRCARHAGRTRSFDDQVRCRTRDQRKRRRELAHGLADRGTAPDRQSRPDSPTPVRSTTSSALASRMAPSSDAPRSGLDARVKIDEHLSVLGSIWHDDSLRQRDAQRRAAQLQLGHTTTRTDYRLGIAHFDDRVRGRIAPYIDRCRRRCHPSLARQRWKFSASTSIALEQAESTDLPTRHRIGARYALDR